jgi:hypothetical protein
MHAPQEKNQRRASDTESCAPLAAREATLIRRIDSIWDREGFLAGEKTP